MWAAKTPEEIVATVAAALEALRQPPRGPRGTALAEVEDRKIAKRNSPGRRPLTGSPTLPASIDALGPPRSGTRRPLVTDRSLTCDALRDGLVSPEQAGIICDAIEELPTNAATRELAEKTLLDEAGRLHATDLAKAARHLIHVVDPEGTERKAEKDLKRQDRAAHLNRFLAIVEDGAGGVRLRGRGTVEDAAKIKAALLPLTRPTPADQEALDCGEVEEVRDHGARMWDAFVETCGHALASDLPPDAHGARPRVAVTISLDALRDKIDWSTLGDTVSDDGSELLTSRGAPAGVRRRHHPRRAGHPR